MKNITALFTSLALVIAIVALVYSIRMAGFLHQNFNSDATHWQFVSKFSAFATEWMTEHTTLHKENEKLIQYINDLERR